MLINIDKLTIQKARIEAVDTVFPCHTKKHNNPKIYETCCLRALCLERPRCLSFSDNTFSIYNEVFAFVTEILRKNDFQVRYFSG